MKLISVIIPVKNGADTLEKSLITLSKQSLAGKLEIIVLDSASTDKSLDIADRYGAKIIHIPEGTFNHGLTRNIGVKHSTASLLYFTVQDAYLADERQLENMIAHFSDEKVMAITGMQGVVKDDKNNPALWFKRFSKPGTVYKQIDTGKYDALSPYKQFEMIAEWDDVNAMYRKEALLQIPFSETEFAEDKLWAREALRAGMKIVFDPSLIVYHYHHSGFNYSFSLAYIVNYHYFKCFNIYPSLPKFFRLIISSVYQVWKKKLSFSKKIYWTFHNLSRIAGSVISTYIFLFIGKFFGEKVLQSSFYFFCKKVPQGKVN